MNIFLHTMVLLGCWLIATSAILAAFQDNLLLGLGITGIQRTEEKRKCKNIRMGSFNN